MSDIAWTAEHTELEAAVLLSVLNILPVGILLVNENQTATYANAAFLRMWGASKSMVASVKDGNKNLFWHVAEQLEDQDALMEAERISGSAESWEDNFMLKDGRVFRCRSIPLQSEEGGRVWMVTDITDEELSRNDALTGLGNRRSYDEEFPRFVKERAVGTWRAVSLMDIDHFKALNDADGHARGDEVLRCVGEFLSKHVRDGDTAYRIGGEEFLVTSRHRSEAGAADFAERLRSGIMDLRIEHKANGEPGVLTVSVGMSAFRDPQIPGKLFEAVDEALYRAKNSGRNRVERAIILDGEAQLEADFLGAA